MTEHDTDFVLRVSGKHLGEFALADRCDRCLWLKLRLGYKLPYTFFPGIFSTLDSFTKNVVHAHFDTFGQPPTWLKELDVVGYMNPPHFSKFNMHDAESNILLTGAADGILRRKDDSYVIVDYKTAKITSTQDELLPMYEVQLNAYGLISENIGLGPVSDLILVYTEPVTKPVGGCAGAVTADGFELGFRAVLQQVPRDPDKVKRLLKEARMMHDLPAPLAGKDGCKACNLVDQMTVALYQLGDDIDI